jgi:ribonuclease R
VNDTVVAVIEKRGKFWAAEPLFPASPSGPDGRRSRGARRIVLASNRIHGPGGGTVSSGDLVLIQLSGSGRGAGSKVRIARAIGRPDVARDAIEALMLDRGLAREFAPGVLRAAERAREEGLAAALREVREGKRRDLRELATLTIDPATAKDYDDAISAQRLESNKEEGMGESIVRVWVHIADVSAFVPEGSPVDREARRRGTSIYVPGAVEPMLPQALSNDACSLVPGAERATMTVELDLDGAQVVRAAFYRSLIRSDARLDYERVDRIFAERERAEEPWATPLAAAREASAALSRAREQAGGLVLDSEEPEVVFDEHGNVRELRTGAQTESHRLIEHLMIAANEAVARRLAEQQVGCLYRVHERPDPARVARLVAQLASLGVPTPPVPDGMSPSQAAELMGEVSHRVERHVQAALRRAAGSHGNGSGSRSGAAGVANRAGRGRGRDGREEGRREEEKAATADDLRGGPWGGRLALRTLVLRSLKQAYYTPKNIGHAGLHSACYCHFTSPIRRYPDLVCHRALISTLSGETPAPHERQLGELGEWTSEREREAMRIERDGDDIARCFALDQALYEGGWEQTFTGEVTGLISAGAFIAFGGAGVREDAGVVDGPRGPLYEGMLPVRRMRSEDGRDWWELNETQTILRGQRTGATIRLGDSIEVRVARVDTARGRVDLMPARE